MKGVRLLLVLGIAVFCLAYFVFSSGSHRLDDKHTALPTAGPMEELLIGEPICFQNLKIFPVLSKTPRTSDRFTTLDEGIRAGTVEIHEKGAASIGDQPTATQSPV